MRVATNSHFLGPGHGHPTLLALRLLQGKYHVPILTPLLAELYLQVVQEYERAVIFRLGRLLSGGSRGPGEYTHHTLKPLK